MSIFITGLVIVKLPLGPLRGWLAYPLGLWHRVKLNRCIDMLLPVVQSRLKEWNDGYIREDRCDAIEWSLMLSDSPATINARRLAQELMHNVWAGTSAPGGLVTDIIFQLLLEPRYQQPLLDEAKKALGADGHWTERALSRLPLLDSFIREINRLYPTGSSKA
jgi:aspirochlorine biosynthesis cytochrome P450 monooxygenase